MVGSVHGVSLPHPFVCLFILDSIRDPLFVCCSQTQIESFTVHGMDFSSQSISSVQLACIIASKYSKILTQNSNDFVSSKLSCLPSFLNSLARTFSKPLAEQRAEQNAKGFNFPPVIFREDLALLKKCKGDISLAVSMKQQVFQSSRFNEIRCRTVFKNDPEFLRLLHLSSEGALVEVDESFVPVSVPDAPRASHSRLRACLSKHLFKLWSKGRVLVLPVADLTVDQLKDIHVSPIHWTTKVESDEGRLLVDLSNRRTGSTVNSPETLLSSKERYGELHLPTIVDIVGDWYQFIAVHNVKLKDCRVFKDDISSAFCQFNINSQSAKRLCVILQGLLFVFIVGLFGWAGAPIVFGLLSRALERFLQQRLPRCCIRLYVDDIMSLALKDEAVEIQALVKEFAESVFGPDSVEPTKSCPPSTKQTLIGWTVDLYTESIRPSDRGINKILFAFFAVELDKKVTLRLCQVLASLAQRYSLCLKGMRCFVQPLHHMTTKFAQNSLVMKDLTSAARFCVVMWRVVSVLLYQDSECLSVRLYSILPSSNNFDFILVSDAGPRGLGAVILHKDSLEVLCYSSFVLPFDSADPSFQNCREYMGFLFALLLLCKFVKTVKNSCVLWRTDNMAALSWVERNMSSSVAAQSSLMAVTWLTLKLNLNIKSPEHIPGNTMGVVDDLSRGYKHSLPPSLEVNLNDDAKTKSLFLTCDPTKALDLVDHFVQFEKIHGLVDSILGDN